MIKKTDTITYYVIENEDIPGNYQVVKNGFQFINGDKIPVQYCYYSSNDIKKVFNICKKFNANFISNLDVRKYQNKEKSIVIITRNTNGKIYTIERTSDIGTGVLSSGKYFDGAGENDLARAHNTVIAQGYKQIS